MLGALLALGAVADALGQLPLASGCPAAVVLAHSAKHLLLYLLPSATEQNSNVACSVNLVYQVCTAAQLLVKFTKILANFTKHACV